MQNAMHSRQEEGEALAAEAIGDVIRYWGFREILGRVWTILYLPFGALSGFIQVALTFLATQHGLSISEGALLNGASMLTQWLKWLWAPIVDARRPYLTMTS